MNRGPRLQTGVQVLEGTKTLATETPNLKKEGAHEIGSLPSNKPPTNLEEPHAHGEKANLEKSNTQPEYAGKVNLEGSETRANFQRGGKLGQTAALGTSLQNKGELGEERPQGGGEGQ